MRLMRYDVVVIGSGFGGSVAALRLAEKGYSVAVLEAGRRFADDEFPQTSWRAAPVPLGAAAGLLRHPADHLLRPAARGRRRGRRARALRRRRRRRLAGLRQHALRAAAGLLRRPAVARHHRLARRARAALRPGEADARRHARTRWTPRPTGRCGRWPSGWGSAHTFHPTPVGVYIGRPGETVADPYFGGAGPDRTGCLHCGACMTGCRHGAKNTLVKNYLWLAERLGVEVRPLTTVTARCARRRRARATRSTRYAPARGCAKGRRTFEADQVIFAAGALGTQRLLHRMRATGALPHLSDRLGALTRTNSESILGATVPRRRGPAARRGLHRRAWRSPARSTPTRRPTSSRSGTAGAPTRWGCSSRALADGGPAPGRCAGSGTVAAAPGDVRRACCRCGTGPGARSSRWSCSRLDNSLTMRYRRGLVRPAPAGHRPGPRRAEPDLDPGRQPGGPAARRARSAACPAARSPRRSTCR